MKTIIAKAAMLFFKNWKSKINLKLNQTLNQKKNSFIFFWNFKFNIYTIQQSQFKVKVVDIYDFQRIKQLSFGRHRRTSSIWTICFKKLDLEHTNEAIEILTQEFESQQPLSMAYYRSFPHDKETRCQNWRDFWVMLAELFSSHNASVAIYDTENGNEMVGTSVAKELVYMPKDFDKRFMSEMNYMYAIIKFEDSLLAKAREDIQPALTKSGLVMDVWGVAIKKKHMGKGLLHRMMNINEQLALKAGFGYSFCYATNFKTVISLKKLNYQLLADGKPSEFQALNTKPFEKIDQIQDSSSIWIKKLEPLQSKTPLKNDHLAYILSIYKLFQLIFTHHRYQFIITF